MKLNQWMFCMWLCFSSGFLSGEPISIMTVGDSLTQAGKYQEILYGLLKKSGHDVVFVGSKKGPTVDGVDLYHEGRGGYTIGPGKSKADEWSNGTGNIYVNVPTYFKIKPHYVLLMIGTNEYFNIKELQPDYKPDEQGAERLKALVELIHQHSPDSKILVASIPPVAWSKTFAAPLNAKIPILLKDLPYVHFVDMNQKVKFVTGDWKPDNLHPSDQGYEKIAHVWFEALNPLLGGK